MSYIVDAATITDFSHVIKLTVGITPRPISTPNPTIEPLPVQETQVEEVVSENRWGNISLTDEDKELLAKIIWLEARGESDIGEQAVIEVIFNRMFYHNKSLTSILSAKNQFATWEHRHKGVVTERELANIQAVIEGNTNITTLDVYYFGKSWYNSKRYIKLENHRFCYK